MMVALASAPPTSSSIVHDTVELARAALDMEMAFVSDTRGGVQEFVDIAGDADSFDAAVGEGPELDETFCGRLLDGRLDGLVRDAQADERVADLEATRSSNVGSYVGVPVPLPTARPTAPSAASATTATPRCASATCASWPAWRG
jgi:hypothetical protein